MATFALSGCGCGGGGVVLLLLREEDTKDVVAREETADEEGDQLAAALRPLRWAGHVPNPTFTSRGGRGGRNSASGNPTCLRGVNAQNTSFHILEKSFCTI